MGWEHHSCQPVHATGFSEPRKLTHGCSHPFSFARRARVERRIGRQGPTIAWCISSGPSKFTHRIESGSGRRRWSPLDRLDPLTQIATLGLIVGWFLHVDDSALLFATQSFDWLRGWRVGRTSVTIQTSPWKVMVARLLCQHALMRANTLTRFARPPHDLLHTFPRQLAPASSTTRAQE